jgi:hypothetical protein
LRGAAGGWGRLALRPPRRADEAARTATRIAAGAVVLVALPGFIGALADILD